MRIAVLSDIHSNLVALDAVLAHARLGRRRSGTSATSSATGPSPTPWSSASASLGAVGVRGNHDAAAAGGDEIDYFNPEARAAMEWTRRRISDATRAWLAALPERRVEDGHHPGPRQPARPDLGVRHVAGRRAGRLAVMTTHARAPRPHARAGRVRRDRWAARGRSRRRTARRLALDGSRRAAQPGQRRPAARRRPAGELPGPRPGARLGDAGTASPTTSMPVATAMRAAGLPDRLAERLRHGV